MAIKLSTALKNHLLAGGSLKSGLEAGANSDFLIGIYGGTEPASADDATPAAALAIVSISGTTPVASNGLTFAASASGGVLTKTVAETWRCLAANVTSGTPTFYRIYRSDDVATDADPTSFRLQGTCGASGSDLNIGIAALVNGSTQVDVGAFEIRLP